MAEEKEAFLARWSRLKREEKQPAQEEKEEAPAPALPPVESLTPESEFTDFMHPKVADALRRVALKKLFSDPHFNVPDPYEAYSGDWTGGEVISEEMLATLNQARTHLFKEPDEQGAQEKAPGAQGEDAARAAPTGNDDDEPGRQDA